MQNVNLDRGAVARLGVEFEALLRELPEERRKMYERVGAAVLARVRGRIGGSGKVQGWQDAFVGSGGGYVAVRAVAKVFENGYAVGQITNAVENGHRQEKGRYVPGLGKRLVRNSIPGKRAYAQTTREAEEIAYGAMETFVRQMEQKLEG